MTVVTTTNIILDNNPCRNIPSNDLAALMGINGWGKHTTIKLYRTVCGVFGRQRAYWVFGLKTIRIRRYSQQNVYIEPSHQGVNMRQWLSMGQTTINCVRVCVCERDCRKGKLASAEIIYAVDA
jgi:hypothetical protein